MDWPADIKAYDTGNEHMLMFADMLSDGIIKQNPKKDHHLGALAAPPPAAIPRSSRAARATRSDSGLCG